ncbi:MAG: exonuclease domain-containing protein [Clostridia bacterium]|jgi:DNA polymerase III epsilon subunit family exonuclease|nr:exonuclease domain-containing protein [Clostridia bacterium]
MNILEQAFKKRFDNKYTLIKPLSAVYSKSTDECTITMLYADSLGDVSENDRAEINNFLRDYLKDECTVITKFKKSYLDELVIIKQILEFVSINFSSLYPSILQQKIISKITNEQVQINICILSTFFEVAVKKELGKNIERYFSTNYFGNFSVNLENYEDTEYQQAISKQRDKLRNEIIRASQAEPTVQKMTICDVKLLLGTVILGMPNYIKDIKQPVKYVILAGKISELTERTRKKTVKFSEVSIMQNIENIQSENIETGDTYFSFILNDGSGSLHAVFFPNAVTRAKFKKLSDGIEILVEGEISEFNGKLSIRVKNISYCKLPEVKLELITYKPVPQNYVYVQPEKMIYTEQSNFLENDSNKHIPQFLSNNDVVVLDVETTGLNYEIDTIIEIGAVKMIKGEIVESFSSLIYPERKLSEEIIQITGIIDSDLAGKPLINQVIPDFFKFCENCVIVGHNLPFDYSFIETAAKKTGYHFAHKQFDTLILARTFIRGLKNYRLKTIAEYLKVSLDNAHRATNDALATAQVFSKLCENVK